jgi:hypothetical protein
VERWDGHAEDFFERGQHDDGKHDEGRRDDHEQVLPPAVARPHLLIRQPVHNAIQET